MMPSSVQAAIDVTLTSKVREALLWCGY